MEGIPTVPVLFQPGVSGSQRCDGVDAADAIWAAIDTAWNARDAARFAALFTEDAIMEFVDRAETLAGRRAIHKHFSERFPTIAPAYEHRSTVTRVRAVTHGVLAVDGIVEILRDPADGAAAPGLYAKFRVFALLIDHGAGWRFQEMRIYSSQ
jgi:uncharacterized protein (TIGR02246 family)